MDNDILHEFIIDSRENLDALDGELVALETNPDDVKHLAGIFRTVHTIKGTAGFFPFRKLEAIGHAAESLLSRTREGSLRFDTIRATALFATIDAMRQLVERIASCGEEGDADYSTLAEALSLLCDQDGTDAAVALLPSLRSAETPIAAPPPASAATTAALESAESPSGAVRPRTSRSEHPAAKTEPRSRLDAPAANARPKADARIRVDVQLLDSLMNLVGELVLIRNQLLQHANLGSDANLISSSQRLDLVTTELQAAVMKTRMQPIDSVWSRFPRVVRDLATNCGKRINLEMEGKSTELDRTIIEAIGDPLTHLVRNAIDHGIEGPTARRAVGKPEAGTIRLRAYHEGGRVSIEIDDDGAGINSDKVRAKAVEGGLITQEQARTMTVSESYGLIFLPSLSTAAAVTNISGRGVGMDVVKSNVERLGGSVDVDSRLGRGTTIRVRIPLTLAIIPALIVGCGGERFAIPQVNLEELVRLEAEEAKSAIERIDSVPLFRLRGNLLALADLREVLELAPDPEPRDTSIIVLQSDERQFGLLVDQIYDTEEIVVKPLSRELKRLSIYAGATIMGDGRVALILDVGGLGDRTGVAEAEGRPTSARTESGEFVTQRPEQLLVFRLGGDCRMALSIASVARLEEFRPDLVERVGRTPVVQYRNSILPLIYLNDIFCESISASAALQVVVHTHEGRDVGLVVEAIEDVVEHDVSSTLPGGRQGVIGSTVIQGRVTELLDPIAVRSLGGCL